MTSEKKEKTPFWVGLLIYILVVAAILVPTLMWTINENNKSEERIRVQTLCEFQGGTFISAGNRCVANDGFIMIEEKN